MPGPHTHTRESAVEPARLSRLLHALWTFTDNRILGLGAAIKGGEALTELVVSLLSLFEYFAIA